MTTPPAKTPPARDRRFDTVTITFTRADRRPWPAVDRVRRLLKLAGRSCGLRCTSIRSGDDRAAAAANFFAEPGGGTVMLKSSHSPHETARPQRARETPS